MAVWYQQLVSHHAREPQSLEDIRTYGHQICKDFVCRKLSKLNLIKPQSSWTAGVKKPSFGRRIAFQGVSAISNFMLGSGSPAQSSQAFSQLCDDFQTVATQLESTYPDLYKNVCSQMGINIGWEHDKITDAYTKFAHALVYKPGEPEPQISWVKIVSLLCIGSGLAVDCARNDKWNTIPRIIDTFDTLVTKILAGWIMEQNGWALPPELTPNQFFRMRRIWLVCNSCLVVLVLILLMLWRLC